MRFRILTLSLALAAASACADRTTAPEAAPDTETLAQVLATGSPAAATMAAETPVVRGLHALPDSLRLTREQRAKIAATLEAHAKAIEADRTALRTIMEEARAAHAAGKSRDDVAKIMEKAAPILARLAEATKVLETAILEVLTPAQKAWLSANAPQRCDRSKFPPLTEAQKTQIKALVGAFEAANKADLELVAKVMVDARAAHAAGKTRQEISAILQPAIPAMERLAKARAELQAKIMEVYTPEQRASGCVR